jgi:outer membrane protein/protease secretion system outer membrane protein
MFCTLAGLSHMALALDLSAAYEAALAHDPGIRAARAAAQAGGERLPQARAQWLPSVSFNASRSKNKLDASSSNLLGVAQDGQSEYFSQNQSLTLRQTVFNRAKSANLEQAGYQVADSDALLSLEMQNLGVRVGSAYFNVLLADDQLALLLSQETLLMAQLDAAQKMLIAGSGTRTDIDEVQARLDMSAAYLLEARQSADYARQQLVVLIRQPVDQLEPLDAQRMNFSPSNESTLLQWQTLADQHSPEIRVLEARSEVARLQIEKTRAGHMPTLDLVAQRSISDSENVTRLNSIYDTRSLGVQLSVPLFAGGYVNSTVRQALAEHARAVEMLEAARLDIRLRVHKEFRGVTEGVLRIKALEQAVRSADQLVLSSRKSAQAGLRTVLDVLKAESQRMQSLRDLMKARYDYLLSKLRLSELAGAVTQDAVDQINGYLRQRGESGLKQRCSAHMIGTMSPNEATCE